MATFRVVDQFLPSLSYGDAIGNHAMQLRRLLRSRFDSDIFFDGCDPVMELEGEHYGAYERRFQDPRSAAIIYHLSIGSSLADYLLQRDEPLVIDYHDLTPPEFFAPYDPDKADSLEEGQWQLESLAARTTLAWSDSEYARADLERAGYRRIAVLPILLDFDRFSRPADRRTLRWLRETKGEGPDILFVGRVAPNKCHHDLIKLVRMYSELYDRPARLICVGPYLSGSERYARALHEFIEELDVRDRVVMSGPVSLSELRAYYQGSDVFVSMSEHEGFCVPVLEAMYAGLPVVAYGAAAVPETVGCGGVILERKDLVEFAVAVHRVCSDHDAREQIVRAGRRRVGDFAPERVLQRYSQQLLPLL